MLRKDINTQKGNIIIIIIIIIIINKIRRCKNTKNGGVGKSCK